MSARLFDWNDLETFLATARGGTLAAAAATLRVDASTVQRRVGKLESTMRTRLFARSQRGYSLTAAGEELLGHVERMEEQATAARRKVVARDDALAGTVRVATVDDLAVSVLSPIVRSFRDAHPSVLIEVDVHPGFSDLARQQADVAVRFGPTPPDGHLVAKHLARVGGALYASRAYLRRHPPLRDADDLRTHAVVRGLGGGVPAMERFLDRHADPERVALRSNSFYVRLAAIRDGIGVGFLGCFMGDRERGLVRLPFGHLEVSNLWLLVHVDVRRNARVRAFVEHVEAAWVPLRPLFAG